MPSEVSLTIRSGFDAEEGEGFAWVAFLAGDAADEE